MFKDDSMIKCVDKFGDAVQKEADFLRANREKAFKDLRDLVSTVEEELPKAIKNLKKIEEISKRDASLHGKGLESHKKLKTQITEAKYNINKVIDEAKDKTLNKPKDQQADNPLHGWEDVNGKK